MLNKPGRLRVLNVPPPAQQIQSGSAVTAMHASTSSALVQKDNLAAGKLTPQWLSKPAQVSLLTRFGMFSRC
jgi:hypothetical protein